MDLKMGGVPQAVRTIVTGLSELGVENEVASLDNSDLQQHTFDFPFHPLGPGKSPWSYSKKMNDWLMSNICQFDVVIVHGLWLYYGFAVTKAFKKLKKLKNSGNKNFHKRPSFFVMPHGMLDPYFQSTSGRKLKAVRNSLYWRLIESKMIEQADGLLYTCEEELQQARQTFPRFNPKKELIAGLGVEKPPAYTLSMKNSFIRQCNQAAQHPYLLFLSRIDEKKGIDLLIKAYTNIVNHRSLWGINTLPRITSESKAESAFAINQFPKLIIAGPGLETVYGSKMLQLAGDLNQLNTNIFFCGMLTGDAKWGAFYGCEAFILPSHQENFGIVVVEALACGKPVLISNRVNIWKELFNNGCAIVADDTQNGTEHILKSFDDLNNTSRDELSTKATDCFQQQFSLQTASRKLLNVLNHRA